MSEELAGRTALVTGSSRGVGLGVARRLVRAGATVVVHGRDPDRLAAARADLGAPYAVAGDLGDPESVDRVRVEVLDAVGVPDVVVANAGGADVRPGRLDEMDVAAWDRVVRDNLTATFLTLRAFVPGMRERGSGAVVTVSSTAVRIATPQSPAAYTMTKAGIEMLTKSLAVQAGPDGVRVNCVALAAVLTERNQERLTADVQDRIAAGYPLRRLGTVDDVGDAVLWLVSDASGWVTGQVVDLAGGSSTT